MQSHAFPKPSQARPGPAFWVRRMTFFRQFSEGSDKIIRDIPLRLGLNILWAKANDGYSSDELFSSGLSGHAAGKTTLMRFVRYILGESSFGNATQVQSIRRAFPHGWVVGEVVVNQQHWLVCRPFRAVDEPFVYSDTTFDELFSTQAPAQKFVAFQSALHRAVLSGLAVRSLPVSGKEIGWHQVLAWLARDQECRMSDLLNWRDPQSDSPSLQIGSTDQTALVRTFLGLLDADERSTAAKHERLKKERENARKDLPRLRYHADCERESLESSLGQRLPALGDLIFPIVAQNIESKRKALENASKQGGAIALRANVTRLEKAWKSALDEKSEKQSKLSEVEAQIKLFQQTGDVIKGKIVNEDRNTFIAALRVPGKTCNVPLDEARAGGCPLVQPTSLIDFGDRRAAQSTDVAIANADAKVIQLRTSEQGLRAAVQEAEKKADRIFKDLTRERTRAHEKSATEATLTAEIRHLQNMEQRALNSWKSATDCERKTKILNHEIGESQKQLTLLRNSHQDRAGKFQHYFEHIVQAMLGTDVTGEIKMSATGIAAKVDRHGDCSSAAINIIKVIAFDLAALCAGIEGFGEFPCFLVHDGPREADLATGLYRRIFEYVRELEEVCSQSGNINFQYIITTTEPPPISMQKSPWLIQPVLDAAKPQDRLLGVDL